MSMARSGRPSRERAMRLRKWGESLWSVSARNDRGEMFMLTHVIPWFLSRSKKASRLWSMRAQVRDGMRAGHEAD